MYAQAAMITIGTQIDCCCSVYHAPPEFMNTPFVLDTPCVGGLNHREVAKRRFAGPPHGSFTPTVVLTEPPPLRDPACAGLWLDGSTIVIPAVIARSGGNPTPQQVFSLAPFREVVAYQTALARALASYRN